MADLAYRWLHNPNCESQVHMMPTTDQRQDALARYCARLRRDLGGELDAVLLYGSQAKGEATEGSDIDVLIIMKEPFEYGEMLERTSAVTAEISLEHDVVLSRMFFARKDFESKQTPFLMNVRREAVQL